MHYDIPKFEMGGSKINMLYFMSDMKDIQPRKGTVQQHIQQEPWKRYIGKCMFTTLSLVTLARLNPLQLFRLKTKNTNPMKHSP